MKSVIIAMLMALMLAQTQELMAHSGRIAPMYSHYYLTKDGVDYSVWIIRPTFWLPSDWSDSHIPLNAFVRDASKPYDSKRESLFGEVAVNNTEEYWSAREEEARKLLGVLREQNREEYVRQGYYKTPEMAAQQDAVFDEIFNGRSSFVAVTEKDNPQNVFQQIAVVPDKGNGLPLDQDLVRNGHNPLRASRVTARNFNEFDFPKEGSTDSAVNPSLEAGPLGEKRMKRTWISGAKVEVKALLKNRASPEDFTEEIFRQVISQDLLKESQIAIPPSMQQNTPAHEWISFYEWSGKPLFYMNDNSVVGSFQGFHLVNSAGWLLEPLWATTLRNTEVYLSAHSEALKRLYERGMGFDGDLTRLIKDSSGNKKFILQASASQIEETAWENIIKRRKEGSETILRPSTKGFDGREVGYIRLESIGEGHRRRLLKFLAPKADELMQAYEPHFQSIQGNRKKAIESGDKRSLFGEHNDFFDWEARIADEIHRAGDSATSCAENFQILQKGSNSVFKTPYEVFKGVHKLDVLR